MTNNPLTDRLSLFESLHKETFEGVLIIAIAGFFGGIIATDSWFVLGGMVALVGFILGMAHLPGVERVTREYLETYGYPDEPDEEQPEPDVVVDPDSVIAIGEGDEQRFVLGEELLEETGR